MRISSPAGVVASVILVLACRTVLGQGFCDDMPPWISYSVDKPGFFSPQQVLRTADPVVALTPEEIEKFKAGIPDEACQPLCDAYVNRIEEAYAKLAKAPEGFFDWLRGNDELRKAFLAALNPFYDEIENAIGVLNLLRIEEPAKTVENPQLAVAIAVVWDSKNAVYGSRYNCVGGITFQQYLPLPSPVDVLRYYTDKKYQQHFVFKIKDLVWPLAVHIADNDVSTREAEWALASFEKGKERIGLLYDRVQYDYSKLNSATRTGKLGNREYTLPNLLEFGGICGDQAHFCSRSAKCFAIPAMKAGGTSRYGGVGHAFTCFITKKKNRMILDSTGRYFHDFYYTGDVFDPQTRVPILDRTVAMVLDGASLSYDKYMMSRILVRIAAAVYRDNPAISLGLAKKALQKNWFCADGWRILMKHVKDGNMPRSDGLEWANNMMKYVKDHPDLTFECFSTFLECMPKEDTSKRQSFYQQAASLYDDRPDLQIDLRHMQGKELLEAGKSLEAIDLLIRTAAEHGKQGRIVNPLVKIALEAAKEKKAEKMILPHLDKLVMRYPKARGDEIADAFKNLAEMVAPVYEAAGRPKDAAKLRAEAKID